MTRSEIKILLQGNEIKKEINVKGWVRTKRVSKNVAFITLNDGSTINNLQIVIDFNKLDENELNRINTGAAISVDGKLMESAGSGQKIELIADKIDIIGEANPDEYPLQPKKHSLEFLREIAHLRFRTNTFSAITRIRHAVIFAIHKFYTERGFCNIHTPIITGSDCEGAGQMFRVSTLDAKTPPLNEDGTVDFKQDFFGKETKLTVS